MDSEQAMGATGFALEPYLVAMVALAILWALYVVATRDIRIWRLSIGADGLYSTSKFQVFLWTVVILFTYVAVFWARVIVGQGAAAIGTIPQNVLIALGLVLVSGVGAYGITTQRVDEQQTVKNTPTPKQPTRLASLVEEDDARPSLIKVQLLAWTAVAILAYLVATTAVVTETLQWVKDTEPLPELPDIDAMLMVLMGLGQGVYLSGKLIQRDSTGLVELKPEEAVPGTEVKAVGVGLGKVRGESELRLNDSVIAAKTWSDTAIAFDIPAEPPWGGSWKPDQLVRVNVVVGGKPGATAEWLRVT